MSTRTAAEQLRAQPVPGGHSGSTFWRSLAVAAVAGLWAVASAVSVTFGTTAIADEANVEDVKVDCDAARVCSFAVTVRHADTGWDHYANHWRVVAADGASKGEELGKRVLHHPHENEQPFTRSLSGLAIPADVTKVIVEAHDSVHAYGGETLTVTIP